MRLARQAHSRPVGLREARLRSRCTTSSRRAPAAVARAEKRARIDEHPVTAMQHAPPHRPRSNRAVPIHCCTSSHLTWAVRHWRCVRGALHALAALRQQMRGQREWQQQSLQAALHPWAPTVLLRHPQHHQLAAPLPERWEAAALQPKHRWQPALRASLGRSGLQHPPQWLPCPCQPASLQTGRLARAPRAWQPQPPELRKAGRPWQAAAGGQRRPAAGWAGRWCPLPPWLLPSCPPPSPLPPALPRLPCLRAAGCRSLGGKPVQVCRQHCRCAARAWRCWRPRVLRPCCRCGWARRKLARHRRTRQLAGQALQRSLRRHRRQGSRSRCTPCRCSSWTSGCRHQPQLRPVRTLHWCPLLPPGRALLPPRRRPPCRCWPAQSARHCRRLARPPLALLAHPLCPAWRLCCGRPRAGSCQPERRQRRQLGAAPSPALHAAVVVPPPAYMWLRTADLACAATAERPVCTACGHGISNLS